MLFCLCALVAVLALFGASWAHLGAILGPFWGYLGPSWGYLGAFWGYLGPSWGYLGPSWGPCWGYLGPSWGRFEAILEPTSGCRLLAAGFWLLAAGCCLLGMGWKPRKVEESSTPPSLSIQKTPKNHTIFPSDDHAATLTATTLTTRIALTTAGLTDPEE